MPSRHDSVFRERIHFMANKVTIQDIADALGISRNTVSKAINNTGVLADATREKVLRQAAQMGYKHFSYFTGTDLKKPELLASDSVKAGEFVLLTTVFWGESYFISAIADTFQRELSRLGCRLTMYRVLDYEVDSRKLPDSFDLKRVSGIICFEMFDLGYCDMLCSLHIPILFVDAPAASLNRPFHADRLLPDSQSSICTFVAEMVHRNKKKIGFVGEYLHCQSFFERYMGYRAAMVLSGLPAMDEYCILGNKEGVKHPGSPDYQEYLTGQLSNMDRLPEVFVCANDFVAIDLLHVLRKAGISVPDDVYLCGFDNTSESRMVTPPLTTIHIYSEVMGRCAAYLLLSRIQDPSMNFRTVHTETMVLLRESTNDSPA